MFILGPSHHVYLDGCAVSKCTEYETPIGGLKLDRKSALLFRGYRQDKADLTALKAIAELEKTGKFDKMSISTDEDEHR